MEIKSQDNIRTLLAGITLPRMMRVRQHFPDARIEDVEGCIRAKLREQGLASRISPGMRVVLTGGSRGIANIAVILREVAAFVKECGAVPVIVPAMGSHGGSTAEGQRQILTEYGITEELCGCEIVASMETVVTGHTQDGHPVYLDKYAHEADAIIPVGRIKPHTAFRGPYESGLMKMLGIGLGKQKGADSLHNEGFGVFRERIPAFGQVIIDTNNVIFGVGLIENAYEHTCRIEVVKGEEIAEKEPPLLEFAKVQMARILFPETDILVVREIGKNISGSGMDPNITGTFSTPYAQGGIRKQRTVVLDLTEESHGNAIGVGKSDTTTMRMFNKIDFTTLYPNMLTSTVVAPGVIPMVMEDDKMAIEAAIKICTGVDKEKIRIVVIKNTLCMEEIMISETMLEEAEKTEGIEILEAPRAFRFDGNGNLLDLK